MAGHLVPGVTSVTPHARYFALHALIADEAARQRLTVAQTQDLLRRSEVVLAAVSFAHDHGDTAIPRAHGTDRLAQVLRGGTVSLEQASQPGRGGYATSEWGFWPPYQASEATVLGIVGPDRKMLTTGRAYDAAAAREGLGPLLDLARTPGDLRVFDLAPLGDRLCVCAGGGAPDGQWIARLMCAPGADTEAPRSPAATRRETIRLLARVVGETHVASVSRDFGPVIAFGAFAADDAVAAGLHVTPVWRGVVLRNYAVGAWRRLWCWLVDQVDGYMTVEDLAEALAAQLPDTTVAAFLDELPATVDSAGHLLPAEPDLRKQGDPLPLRELRVLAVTARRVHELDGRTLDAFLGRRGIELGPEWTHHRFTEARPHQLRDFARQLTSDLLTRARRIALSKARTRPDGSLWLPTRLHERAGMLYRTSKESSDDVGLRLGTLTSVLAGSGVLGYTDGRWHVTTAGETLVV
ncbi:hypothetical protein [Streptomyces sp. NBC_01244]|uniref:hypothetical protein n=1 Tax=Streptomyces sp. NBC_01244 TaxID=2903797 RepID=UPI002E117823|nr:hypothetical protein OG247_33285 [Streptomyces sp. NBC_01244]